MIRLLLLPLLTAVTHATDHKVLVGNRVYNPANITAIPGDTITFQLFVLVYLSCHLIILNIL